MTDLMAWREKAPRQNPEADLQRAIVQHLMLRGHPDAIWFHPMNSAPVSKRTAGNFKRLGVVAGVSDLVLIRPDGSPAMMELKAVGGKLSPAQRQFRDKCLAIGVDHVVVADIDSALHILEAWGIIR